MLDFGIPFGSEPGRRRPVVIIQADKENLDNLNTKVIVPLTSNTINADLRGNVFLPKNLLSKIEEEIDYVTKE